MTPATDRGAARAPHTRPLRVALTSDLHVDSTDANRALLPHLARAVRERAADVLVIAGDVSAYPENLAAVLQAFAEAAPTRLFVPGNHDVWVARSAQDAGATSSAKYVGEIAEVCRASGFVHLGLAPHVVGDVGFAGTIGWYDYSFADPAFGFTRAELARKSFERRRWMDALYARWVGPDGATPLSDPDVTQQCAAALASQLTSLSARSRLRAIVVVSHHLPYADVLRRPRERAHAYFGTFLGARVLGDVIDAAPLVRAILVGHLHRPIDERRPSGARCVSSPVGYLRPPPEDLAALAGARVALVEV